MEEKIKRDAQINLIISNLPLILEKAKQRNHNFCLLQTSRQTEKSPDEVGTEVIAEKNVSTSTINEKKQKPSKIKTKLKCPKPDHQMLTALIKDADVKNLRLRKSTAKLQRQQKLQDMKMRDIRYKISLEKQKVLKWQQDQKTIQDLEETLKKKKKEENDLELEIHMLKLNLGNKNCSQLQSKADSVRNFSGQSFLKPQKKVHSDCTSLAPDVNRLLVELKKFTENSKKVAGDEGNCEQLINLVEKQERMTKFIEKYNINAGTSKQRVSSSSITIPQLETNLYFGRVSLPSTQQSSSMSTISLVSARSSLQSCSQTRFKDLKDTKTVALTKQRKFY